MDKIIWNSFFKEMEKNAIATFMPSVMAGFTALDIGAMSHENNSTTKLTAPGTPRTSSRLAPSNQYRFGGSKRVDSLQHQPRFT